MKINILTDSTADLGEELTTKYKINVIPLLVTIGEEVYLDGLEIDQEKLFRLVTQTGILPKTSAPSIGEFEAFFQREGENIFIGISSKLSATIDNARQAIPDDQGSKTRIINSFNLSTGTGLLALYAAELRDSNKTSDEIEKEVLNRVSKVRTSFLIDTMDYLYKGGRCNALQAFAGSVLKIHPIIEVRADGTLGVKEKARGTRQRCLQFLLDDLRENLPKLDRHRIFVTHTTSHEDAMFLKNEIERIADPDEVLITRAGSVIASHCGPGTIGIIYFEK